MTKKSSVTEILNLDDRSRLERELLARRRARLGATPVELEQTPGASKPLSSAQQRLWFIQALDPSSPTYNISKCYRVQGPLNLAALREAIDDVVARHETLRSTFPAKRRVPHVSVEPGSFPGLSVLEIPAGASDICEAEAMRIIEDEANTPFDLTSGPVFRPTLIALSPNDHFLLFVLHHIVCDEWSLRNLYQEVGEAYRAHSRGMEADLPALPVQYSDFALWQRKQLSSGAYDSSRSYWQAALKGVSENFTIPYDPIRQRGRQPAIHRHNWLIAPDLIESVDRLGQEVGATPFMTMLAAFSAVLYGWVGEEDIVIGTPTADRRRAEFENLIGYFSNTLIMRVSATGDPTFLDFLRQVRGRVIEGIGHQDLPFDQVVEAINPQRSSIGNPIFKVMFTHRDAISPTFADPALRVSEIELSRQQAKCDLWLSVKDEKDGRLATLVYDTRLYDEPKIEGLAADLNRVLRLIISSPDTRLSALCANLTGSKGRQKAVPLALPSDGAQSDAAMAPRAKESGNAVIYTNHMLDIWRRVLGKQDIFADDDFFDLGGHSMLALELFAEIDQEFGVSLPLSVLFEAPTVAALVRRIEQAPDPTNSKLAIAMQPLGHKTPIFAVPSGGRSVLMYRSLAQTIGTDHPFYGLEHPGMSDGNTLECVEEVASRYLEEIRELHREQSYILIGNCSGALAAFELAQLLVSEGRGVRQVILINPPCVGEKSTHSKNWWRWQRLKANLIAFGELDGVDRLEYFKDRLRLIWELVHQIFSQKPVLPANQERVYESSRTAVQTYSGGHYEGGVTLVLGMRDVVSGWKSVCSIPPKVLRYYGSSYRKDRYPPIEGDPGGHIREFLEQES